MKREAIASALSVGIAFAPITALDGSDENESGTRSAPNTSSTLDPVETALLRSEVATQLSDARTRAEKREKRRTARTKSKRAGAKGAGGSSKASPQLEAIAACESGGDPKAIGGGGAFRGKFQFSVSTWAAVGGSGDPAAAPESEQNMRAAKLLATSGAGQWPVCGQ